MALTLSNTFHLFSRAGFGCNLKEAEKFRKNGNIKNWIKGQSVSNLEIDLPRYTPAEVKKMSASKRKKMRKESKKYSKKLNAGWIKQMAISPNMFTEKMTLFWHGHFACAVKHPQYLLDLNTIMRENALGNFRDLLVQVSESPAMIGYLHLQQNRKQSPNEDFARELCELFTLGRDTVYTEADIPEIARAFTGWSINKSGEFNVNPKRQDRGTKVIFGENRNFTGYDVIDLILQKRETAFFIASKIYRYFVNPKINTKNVNELTDVFYNSNYDIEKMMIHLFSADWFYAEENKGVKIKSPIELLVGMMRTFHIQMVNNEGFFFIQKILEQILFKPPNVAGWPGDKKWIDSSRLAFRMRLGAVLLGNGTIDIEAPTDLDASEANIKKRGILKKLDASSNWSLFLEENKDIAFTKLLLRGKLSSGANALLKSGAVESEKEEVLRILSLPEYQLC